MHTWLPVKLKIVFSVIKNGLACKKMPVSEFTQGNKRQLGGKDFVLHLGIIHPLFRKPRFFPIYDGEWKLSKTLVCPERLSKEIWAEVKYAWIYKFTNKDFHCPVDLRELASVIQCSCGLILGTFHKLWNVVQKAQIIISLKSVSQQWFGMHWI